MNWNLIAWFAGVCLTLAGIKFVWLVIRKLTSKDTFENVLEAAGDGFSNASYKTSMYLKKKKLERLQRKNAEREVNRPIITIR